MFVQRFDPFICLNTMVTRRNFILGSLSKRTKQQAEVQAGGYLAPYDGAWRASEARHLLRRTGFGAPPDRLQSVLEAGSAQEAAEAIVADAAAVGLPPTPEWFENRENGSGVGPTHDLRRRGDLEVSSPLKHVWFERMRHQGLTGKMELFWHNFFPVGGGLGRGNVYLSFDYYYTLCEHAFGNFKQFVWAIGLRPAMLSYLDGDANQGANPNENYARELLERFTMGPIGPDGHANYSQTDVAEIARALTGWQIADDFSVVFDPSGHDGGVKFFLGRQGMYGYDEVIDIIFEERSSEIAHFVCRKLYCFFVQAQPHESFIAELAEFMEASDFEIAPVLVHLFSTTHFYDEAHPGSRIKSPIEFLAGLMCEGSMQFGEEGREWIRWEMYDKLDRETDNELLRPPNVGGWPGYNPPEQIGGPGGHLAWLSPDALEARREWVRDWKWGFEWPTIAEEITNDLIDPFAVAVALAEYLLPVPLAQLGADIGEVELSHDPTIPPPDWVEEGPGYITTLGALFLDGLPHYNWTPLLEGSDRDQRQADKMIRNYAEKLTDRPEYHLY